MRIRVYIILIAIKSRDDGKSFSSLFFGFDGADERICETDTNSYTSFHIKWAEGVSTQSQCKMPHEKNKQKQKFVYWQLRD